MLIRAFQLSVAMVLLLMLVVAGPAAAQKGMGEQTGVGRQAEKPPIETMSGTIKDIKIGPCERTTGRSLQGVHLIVQADSGKTINLHLGPDAALEAAHGGRGGGPGMGAGRGQSQGRGAGPGGGGCYW